MDAIVIDFFHWTRQGDFKFEPRDWPDPEAMVKELKEMGIETVVSVWPTIDERSENFGTMSEMGYLVNADRGNQNHMTWMGNTVFYDATHPGAQKFVWEKCKENYYKKGIRCFWLDEAEPEYGPYDFDNYRYYAGPALQCSNVYPVGYAKGFYEGLKAEGEKDILSLVRCAWAGSQKYAVLTWSGDIHSSFRSMREQLQAGLNMGMAGIPWWTSDIGGFLGGDISDKSFQELLVRWFEWGAFCPVFRMHGERSPWYEREEEFINGVRQLTSGQDNEVWSFGEENYKILSKYLFIRERLRPYIRECMKAASKTGAPVMRPLFFDFPEDPVCWETEDCYLFGPDLLVAPVMEEWAQTAKDCGFKYLILTTKHHDGFCLWDTRYSDYKVTAPDCPYHVSEHADLVKSMFDAFREKGLGIGAYFSKADWHTPYYRTPELPDPNPSDRGPMYSPVAEPERWENFVQYTKNQVLELCEGYGPIDILWFDAGWVCASNGQDIRLGEIVDEARKIQPGILSVDRTVGGPYENYVTPEMCVPEEPLGVPWESCLTLGADFTYEYADRYKSPRELVNTLVGIVAKGGNLALNVSPQPDGRIPVDAMDSLRGLGEWLKVYGEAIYGTRVCAPYQSGNISFTRKGDAVYAIRLFPVAQESVDSKLFIPYAGKVSKVTMLDSGEDVSFVPGESGITVTVPAGRSGGSAPIALVFKLQ